MKLNKKGQNRIIPYIKFAAPFIYGFLGVLLMYFCFKAGTLFACDSGVMSGNRCVAPKVIELAQVCEYNGVTCVAKCADAIILDRKRFLQTYSSDLVTHVGSP